ncbi:MAG: porin [Granulosicoccus sp.]
MKFTKTAVALAIAGIAAAPMIASADTTLSGAVQIQLNGTDADGDAADPTINADDVLFGIATEHELNSGLTGYGSLRVDMNRLSNAGRQTVDPGTPGNDDDDTEIASVGSADSVYVGIKGGFGDVRFGEIPNAVEYGQVANDIFDVSGEINGGVSYTGTFGPVGLIANFSPEQNQDVVGIGAKFGIGGFSIGLGADDRAEVASTAVGVSFAAAGASIAAHFWTQDSAGDPESMSVKAGYGFGGVTAALTFSTLSAEGASDREAIRLDLGYGLGGGMDISSRITAESDDAPGSEDLTSWRIKLSKSF